MLWRGLEICLLHAMCIGQRTAELPVLYQPYLLKVMYMTIQYRTVLCMPARGHEYDISKSGTYLINKSGTYLTFIDSS